MPRAAGQKDYVSMVGGLVTEASPLNFPEGATSGELNFLLNKERGLRERRGGLEFVYSGTGNTTSEFSGSDSILENMFYWRGTGYVVAIITNSTPETFLRLHRMGDTFTDFSDIQIADERVDTQIAELTNYLVITLSNESKPILLVYDETNNTIDVNEVDIHIRDFELVDDELSASEHPSTLTDNHEYNLLNAGWYVERRDENTSGNPLDSVIDIYNTAFSEYPSNADSVSVGMITNAEGNLTFDPEYVRDAGLGNSLAPRGHYVYSINDFDRDDKLLTPSDDGSPSTTLSLLAAVDSSGQPTYDPDAPDGGGVTPPWNDYPDLPVPPGYEIP